MKETELMIGDIIMAHYDDGETQCYFPSMVIAIFVDRLLCNDGVQIKSISSEYSDFCDEDCINIEPIPITAEILEKNGFKVPIFACIFNPELLQFALPTNEFIPSKFITLNISDNVFIMNDFIQIRYVHELQHALRLCGLDTLADNFKI